MNELNCTIIKDILPLYIDGVVSDESKALIEEHLSHCNNCKKELELLKQPAIIPDNINAKLDEAQPLYVFKKRMKRKKRLTVAVLLVMFLITTVALIAPTFIKRGNPIPYISSAVKISKDTPFTLVNVKHSNYNIYLTKKSNCEEMIKHIENTWDMQLVEQVNGYYFFSNDEQVHLLVPTERYLGIYTVWEVLSIN
ncbi:MAG: zf-HC2 domain-containing protein [Clostridium sp.]|jgi:hypothetical protein|nr:zf-HC2 domain-containing protein [Clostridium sp.]